MRVKGTDGHGAARLTRPGLATLAPPLTRPLPARYAGPRYAGRLRRGRVG